MKILAFDTSTQQCSIALLHQNEISEITINTPNKHAESLLPTIDTLLKEADLSLSQLDIIAFARGPGSFTGLRIGASLAQGLSAPFDIPIASISTLHVIAQAAYERYHASHIAVAIDARMQQIYWGTFVFEGDEAVLLTPESVSHPQEITLHGNGWFGAGNGWSNYETQLHHLRPFVRRVDVTILPHARTLIALALRQKEQNQLISAEHAIPIYLRNKVC